MGYYNDDGQWMEGNAPPAQPRRMPRQMRPAEERQNDPNQGVRRQARRELTQDRYDDDGNLIPAAPLNTEETTDDVVRSASTGLYRAGVGAAGQQGDAREILEAGARWGAERGGASPQAAENFVGTLSNLVTAAFPALRGPGGLNAPTSQEIDESIAPSLPESVRGWTHHEPQTTQGEYARTIGEFAPAVAAPGRATERVARTVVPAVVSETAGQVTEDTALEPWARLAGALGGSGVNEGFLQVLSRQGLTADERALRLMMRELEDQGQDPADIVRQANILLRQAPTEEVLLETLGPGGLRMARAVAAMGEGRGRSIADEALSARAEGQPSMRQTTARPGQRAVSSIRDRIADEATRMTAPQQTRGPRNYWDALDSLRTARAGQARDAYRVAYGAGLDQTAAQTEIIPLMLDGSAEALASGARQLDTEALRLRAMLSDARMSGASVQDLDAIQTQLDDAVAAGRQLQQLSGVRSAREEVGPLRDRLRNLTPDPANDAERKRLRAQLDRLDAQTRTPPQLSPRAVDFYQRGLRHMAESAGVHTQEGSAINSARDTFNRLSDRIAPALGDARSRYGESRRIEELMGEGRRVFEMSEGEIDRLMRGAGGNGLSIEEFDGVMLGVLDAIERKLGASDTGFLARLMRNQNWRNQLEAAVGGRQQAQRFMDRLAREARMQETRNFVQSGSRTQPLSEDIRALTEGEAELGFYAREAQNFITQGASPRAAALRLATGLYERVRRPGIANPQVQEAMARRLFSRVTRDSSQELRDALLALRNDPNVNPSLRDFINTATAVNAATVDERLDDGNSANVWSEYQALREQAEAGMQ
jgi:hypothetical protein